MKKLALLAITATFMFSASLLAQSSVLNSMKDNKVVKQTETKVESSAKARADKMAKDLKLTSAQTTQVTNLFTKQDASVAKLNSQEKVGSATYKTKLAALQKSGDTELQGIIGKDKFQQYQANLAAEKKSMKDKANAKMNAVKPNLNLK